MKSKITAAVLIIALFFTGCSTVNYSGSASSNEATSNEASSSEADTSKVYGGLFDTSYVHTVNVSISEEDWNDLITNPLNKTKYSTTVTVDGESVENVSFATKGNTSLSSVASDKDSDRYSFKINFGKFEDGQTYHGLDKLNLNNIYADATYMKDFISYTIFREAGIDSPLVSYIWLTVNGEDKGLYIGIEEIGESYLERVQDSQGELYKPETSRLDNAGNDKDNADIGMPPAQENTSETANKNEVSDSSENAQTQGNKGNFPGGNMGTPPGNGNTQAPSGDMTPPGGSQGAPSGSENFNMPGGDMQNGEKGGFSMSEGDSGASLKYTDDEISSYTDIFENAETDVTEDDEKRVIEALKKLSQGDTSGLDTDELIRYFAAHNFVMNYDSYTGNMLHNYYLYENSGVLSILPWDYNLAFGSFMNQAGDSKDPDTAVNMGIDSPLLGTTEEDRPMWSWITESEEYTEQYHKVYDELLTSFFESGECEKLMDSVYEMIRPFVEKDPTAFYTVDEFDSAYKMLRQFISLRAESIRKQLSGTLSPVTEDQNTEDRVDASSIDISVMGTHAGGKDRESDMQDMKGGFPAGGTAQSSSQSETQTQIQTDSKTS